ncbi:two-component system response regulator CreB [Paucibacter sp. APW11]|uniref:Two-component system response regulator CreB n=1 Tax=Roseateles aquae TaxID=3077235 RepID=A0ABU3PHC7_9BURK|nr:two-component system response regulator CreB [Paucibacter sp. APW11]MDT9001980.1 two-component system response regulator CreB [Paucibacter sp. APW11]
MVTRILLLEDDPAIAHTVQFSLEREGWQVEHQSWLHEARLSLQQAPPDLALLDLGLPDGNGLDLCRELRQQGSLPIMILSARAEEWDRVLGLELGADDYLSKPFSPRELVARVRALLRRAQASAALPVANQGGFVIEGEGTRLLFEGQLLPLTRRELGLLKTLLAAPSRIFSREHLLDAVWGLSAESLDRTVDTHIKTLRAKLRQAAPQRDPIRTHRGLGYSLELDDD